MVVTSNAKVIAQRMTLHGANRVLRVKAAMPLLGSIVQGEIRAISPYVTGAYRRGVSYRFYQTGKWNLTLEMYSGVEYGKFLEYGTRYISPRRYFQRGSQSAYPKIVAYLKMI